VPTWKPLLTARDSIAEFGRTVRRGVPNIYCRDCAPGSGQTHKESRDIECVPKASQLRSAYLTPTQSKSRLLTLANQSLYKIGLQTDFRECEGIRFVRHLAEKENGTVPLPRLLPAPQQVQVQETAFATDALSRFICSTWEEATGNGDHRSRSSSSERVPTARTSRRRFSDVVRTSESCCWTPAVWDSMADSKPRRGCNDTSKRSVLPNSS
jgi:hypothetical protein